MSFQKQVKIAIDSYIYDYKKSLETNSELELQEAIQDDLLDKNFTEEEIKEILDGQLNKETSYKFLAYFMLLYADWTTANELMNLIEEHSLLDLDEFSEDDIDNITLQQHNIDF